jgi:hypothetical protein
VVVSQVPVLIAKGTESAAQTAEPASIERIATLVFIASAYNSRRTFYRTGLRITGRLLKHFGPVLDHNEK